MKDIIAKTLSLATITILLTFGAGCGKRGTTSRMTTSSTHGRHLTVVIDGRASFQSRNGEHVVSFGGHELVVGSEWLVVDRDKKSFGIPPTAKKVEIEVSDGVLTMSADGSLVTKTPI